MPEDRHSGTPGGGNGSGADVKSGILLAVADDDTGTVNFTTAFASTPAIVLSLKHGSNAAIDTPLVTGSGAGGFAWRLWKGHGGAGHTYDIHWIATDVGDP